MFRARTVGVALVVLSAFAGVGCSVEITTPLPFCFAEGSGLIVTQSVPTATQIPCLDDLEPGWSRASVKVNHERTIVTLDSEEAGDAAARLYFAETCDISEASERASGFDDIVRYDSVDQLLPTFHGSRYYVFEGGCAWWRFEFEGDVGVAGADAIGEILMFVPRTVVNEGVANDFIDEDI